jgi:phage terminase large subunit-like protein
LVRLACERHFRDLETGHRRGLVWEPKKGLWAIRFFSLLHHSKGEWAGQPVTLALWQQFIVASVYGWKRKDRTRRFRTVYEELPRKNGKTTKCSGIGIYGLVADQEPGAEIYAAATRKDQARLIFDEARRMVRSSPLLRGKVGIFKLNLSVDGTASKFEPLSSDDRTLDGLNPSLVLIDELHKHKSRAVLDVLDTALGSRRQPLLWIITTAGDDSPESVYAQENDYAVKVLERVVNEADADSAFVYITTVDADDRWDDPKAWAKANPNLGISVKLDDLKRQAAKAKNSPGALVEFKRLRLNLRTAAADRFIDAEVWRRNTLCPPEMLPGVYRAQLESWLKGRRFFGALDLSSKVDLSAWIKLFPPVDGDDRWHVLARLWMPADTVTDKSDRDQVQYRRWIDEGWIEVTPGNVIDHNEIAIAVEEDCRIYQPASIAYDPWNATQLAVGLQSQGLPMVEFIQGIRSYTAPTKEFEAWLLQTKLDHGSHPVLAWMASNLAVQRDKNENMMPTKRLSRGRIDGLSASIMAIGRWMADEGPSRYEDPNEKMLFV